MSEASMKYKTLLISTILLLLIGSYICFYKTSDLVFHGHYYKVTISRYEEPVPVIPISNTQIIDSEKASDVFYNYFRILNKIRRGELNRGELKKSEYFINEKYDVSNKYGSQNNDHKAYIEALNKIFKGDILLLGKIQYNEYDIFIYSMPGWKRNFDMPIKNIKGKFYRVSDLVYESKLIKQFSMSGWNFDVIRDILLNESSNK